MWHVGSQFFNQGSNACFLQWTARKVPMQLSLFFFKFYLFIYFDVLGLHCCLGFSLVVANGDRSLVMVHRLLTVVASRCRAQALGLTGLSTCG